jgi:NitT/TauT family transport system substrate-binding protein
MRGLRPTGARLCLSILTLVALAANVSARSEDGGPSAAPMRLKVLYGRHLLFAPLAIANAEGFFRAQGLDVELVHMASTSDATPALATGEIDVGAGMIKIAVFNAIARGAELRIVADKGRYGPGPCVSGAILARPGFLRAENADSPGHLRGARASAPPLSFAEYVLETFVKSRGLALSDLDLKAIQAATTVEALSSGTLDITCLAEPFVTRTVRSGFAVIWKPFREIVPDAQVGMLVYGPALLKRNRDAGLRFMVAYLQGVRQYNLGKTPRNVEIVSKETGLDPEIVRGACWEPIRGDGKINVESVLDFQRWAVGRRVLDAVLPPERFWDPSFVEQAGRTLEAASGKAESGR